MASELQLCLCKSTHTDRVFNIKVILDTIMKYVFGIFFSFSLGIGYAQNYFDVATISFTTTTPNHFEISDAQTTVEEFALEVNYPIVLNEKNILLTGLYTNKTKVGLDADHNRYNLNALSLNFGINTILNDSWSATFMVFPKLASDEITFSRENLQIALLSLFTNKKKDDLKLKYGVYANTEKYGMIIVPIMGLYYLSANKKFEANLNLPIVADANYNISNKIWVGMKFDGLGTTYNLMNQNYSVNGAYVSKTSNELVGYLRFQLNKSIYLNAKMGYAISRNYKVFDSDDKVKFSIASLYFGDNRTQLNERFTDGAIFKIELLYRFHFN